MSKNHDTPTRSVVSISQWIAGIAFLITAGALIALSFRAGELSSQMQIILAPADNRDDVCDEEELSQATISDETPCGQILDFLMNRHMYQFKTETNMADIGRRIKS